MANQIPTPRKRNKIRNVPIQLQYNRKHSVLQLHCNTTSMQQILCCKMETKIIKIKTMENILNIEKELEWAINGAKTWTDMLIYFQHSNEKYIECKQTRDEYLQIIVKLIQIKQIEIE